MSNLRRHIHLVLGPRKSQDGTQVFPPEYYNIDDVITSIRTVTSDAGQPEWIVATRETGLNNDHPHYHIAIYFRDGLRKSTIAQRYRTAINNGLHPNQEAELNISFTSKCKITLLRYVMKDEARYHNDPDNGNFTSRQWQQWSHWKREEQCHLYDIQYNTILAWFVSQQRHQNYQLQEVAQEIRAGSHDLRAMLEHEKYGLWSLSHPRQIKEMISISQELRTLQEEDTIQEEMRTIRQTFNLPRPVYQQQFANWMQQFQTPATRYRVFIIQGQTGCGKTQFVMAQFQNPLVHTPTANWATYDPRTHDAIVYDDIVNPVKYIASNRLLTQSPPTVITVNGSNTNCYAKAIRLYRKPQIFLFNVPGEATAEELQYVQANAVWITVPQGETMFDPTAHQPIPQQPVPQQNQPIQVLDSDEEQQLPQILVPETPQQYTPSQTEEIMNQINSQELIHNYDMRNDSDIDDIVDWSNEESDEDERPFKRSRYIDDIAEDSDNNL